MPKRRRVTARQLIKALTQLGFVVVRIHGSHHRLRHPDGRTTTVPVHSGEIIGQGLMNHILRDCDLTYEQLSLHL